MNDFKGMSTLRDRDDANADPYPRTGRTRAERTSEDAYEDDALHVIVERHCGRGTSASEGRGDRITDVVGTAPMGRGAEPRLTASVRAAVTVCEVAVPWERFQSWWMGSESSELGIWLGIVRLETRAICLVRIVRATNSARENVTITVQLAIEMILEKISACAIA